MPSTHPIDLSLYLVLDPVLCGGEDGMIETARAACAGGATVVQLRAPGWKKRQLVECGRALKTVLAPYHVPLIVDDDADVCIAVNADGLHVGQRDLTPEDARAIIGGDRILGLSVTTLAELTAADTTPIDYFGVGPVFATPTKTDAEPACGLIDFRRSPVRQGCRLGHGRHCGRVRRMRATRSQGGCRKAPCDRQSRADNPVKRTLCYRTKGVSESPFARRLCTMLCIEINPGGPAMAEKKKIPTAKMPIEDAKCVLLVRSLEESAAREGVKGLSSADFAEAGLKAAHALGELLAERARRVLAAAKDKGLKTDVATRALLARTLGVLFVIAAFFAGALFDRIASPARIVNLLSPPYWTVIVWNLLIYVLLLLGVVGLLGRKIDGQVNLPLRTTLVRLASGFSFAGLHRGWKGAFLKLWLSVTAPLVRYTVSELLHAAALFFALGLTVSLLVRGFGTAYWAGWESTWLADNPAAVKAFLDHTFGLIPAVGGLPAIPDVDMVEAMRSDRLAYLKEPATAAPWLIRLMVITAVVIVIPRLFLAFLARHRIKKFRAAVPVTLNDTYYETVLSQCRQDAALGRTVILAPQPLIDRQGTALKAFEAAWPDKKGIVLVPVDFDNEALLIPETAPDAADGRKTIVLVWLDAAHTPEDDVHGQGLEILKAQCPEDKTAFVVVIDAAEFSLTFARYPERVWEREKAWQTFCEAHQVRAYTLTGADAAAGIVQKLRTQAAGRALITSKA